MTRIPKRSFPAWPAAITASLLFHALLFAGLVTLGWNVQHELSSAVIVDLLGPTTSIAASVGEFTPSPRKNHLDEQPNSITSFRQPVADPLNESRQETIPLDTHRPKYMNYSEQIKQRIYLHWQYPEQARQSRLQGQLVLEFGILDSGDLAGIKVLRSSGHPSLDRGTIDAIKAATPFPPLPKHFQLDRLNIRARFLYRLVA